MDTGDDFRFDGSGLSAALHNALYIARSIALCAALKCRMGCTTGALVSAGYDMASCM